MYAFFLAYSVAFSASGIAASPASVATLKSPDGRIQLDLTLSDSADSAGELSYSMRYRDKLIVAPSKLALDLDSGPLGRNLRVTSSQTGELNSSWRPVYGERSIIPDSYRWLELTLQEAVAPHRSFRLDCRVYNEGAAFRYHLLPQSSEGRVKVLRERSEFCFAQDYPAWAVYSAQGKYERVPLSQIKPRCERPLTVEIDSVTCAAVAEAALVDYARMRLSPLMPGSPCLVSTLEGEVEAALPMTTPWRVVMVADSPGHLLEHNYLLMNLNEPCVLKDVSWIKPGKVIREVTLTTAGGKACVDFAARRGLQYVEFDAGWYGPENSPTSDATRVNVDPKRSRGPLDLHEVIGYARERGIGIILYVNHIALERQMDELFPLYRSWGVSGVKFGFVRVGSQEATRWLHAAVRAAAEQHLMVDIHDEYRPTGYSRTYPNLMTQEGIAGDETSPPNSLTLAILFTRMLAGAADNTICYYDTRVERNATHAYQLAKAVCLYSPWQFVYWYDRPPASPTKVGGAGGEQRIVGGEPELAFFDALPTVWDETRVLTGEIGVYAGVARRRGREWYVGCMNSGEPRELQIPLSFLNPSERYRAIIYRHDPSVPSRTHVRIEEQDVEHGTILAVALSATGGQAIRIVPKKG